MTNKYTNEQLREIVECEGLDYTFSAYLSTDEIADETLKSEVKKYLQHRATILDILELEDG